LQLERQLLATVRHAKKKIPHTASEAHHIEVRIPTLRSSAAHRCVWCPRSQPADKGGVVPPPSEDQVLRAESQLPVWNAARRSLSLRFADGRVKKASAKNFLMSMMKADDVMRGSVVTDKERAIATPDQKHGILQVSIPTLQYASQHCSHKHGILQVSIPTLRRSVRHPLGPLAVSHW